MIMTRRIKNGTQATGLNTRSCSGLRARSDTIIFAQLVDTIAADFEKLDPSDIED